MPIRRRSGETKEDFLGRCIPIEINSGKQQDQAVAICIAYWEEKQLSAVKSIRRKNRKFKKELEFKKTRVYVDSSNVDRVMYDNETSILVVRFNDGETYTYENISENTFEKLIDGVDAPKTSGSNDWGSWREGVGPSVGATLYKRIIRYDKGRKGGDFR